MGKFMRGAFVLALAAAGFSPASPASAQDIFQAIQKGDIEQVKSILEKDAGAVQSRQGAIFPLHQAARQGNKAIAELLLAKGADINRFGAEATAFTPYEFTPLTEAVRLGRMELVRVFVEKGADVKRVTSHGETYLHFAAFANQKEAAALFIDRGIDVNVRKRGDVTPLHLAAALGFDELAGLLIDKGAALDVRTTDGATALHLAEAAGHAKTAALLKAKGAKELPRNFPRYAGAYLGVKKPGLTPEPFAPEIFRDIYRAHSSPAFSPDGKEVYWECMFMWGSNDAHRIWFMKEENGRWTPPRIAPFSKVPSGTPAFFADGKSLVFFSLQSRDAGGAPAKDPDLWIVSKEGDGWSPARHLDTPLNQDGSGETFPFVAKDGSIYLIRTLQGGAQGFVKSAFVGGKYAQVESIGDLFDKPATDTCLAMEFLLFASYRKRGNFEYELYVSFHGPDGRWSTPAYLGERLHPGRRSYGARVTWDGKYLFLDRYFSYEWVDARVLDEPRPTSGK